MTEPDHYNLIVVGGGMAGLPVALKSAYTGLKTALVEQDLLGGTCLSRVVRLLVNDTSGTPGDASLSVGCPLQDRSQQGPQFPPILREFVLDARGNLVVLRPGDEPSLDEVREAIGEGG